MADKIDLKKFIEYLQQAPPKGSNAPPRTIPVKTLDKNFKKVTVIEDPEPDDTNDRSYKVDYTDDGTVLKIKKLPKGVNRSDILYWNPDADAQNGGAWDVLSSVESDNLFVLGIRNRQLQWVATEDCEEQ